MPTECSKNQAGSNLSFSSLPEPKREWPAPPDAGHAFTGKRLATGSRVYLRISEFRFRKMFLRNLLRQNVSCSCDRTSCLALDLKGFIHSARMLNLNAL